MTQSDTAKTAQQQNDLDALVRAAQACRDMLVEYAVADELAQLENFGTWTDPHERIADVVRQVDHSIAAIQV